MFTTFSVSSYSQYCTAVGPSQTTWSNIESANLVGDASNISYTGCPGVVGLEDLTGSQMVSLSANSSYALDVLFGACNNDYWPSAGEAWIDYNGNETFEPAESIGTWQGDPPVPVTNFNFTVPSDCATGIVRLRLTHQESVTPPLDPCASFTWGATMDFSVELSGGTGPNLTNYCVGGPSSTADSNLGQLSITGEAGSYIGFTGCPGVIGLDDQTQNYAVDLAPGNSYSLDLTFGTCGGTYAGAGEAWIDYNMNGVFETTESIGTWSGTPVASTVFNFTVPGGLAYGATRMRVVQMEGGTPPLDPCANYTWGSTTDFTVNIGDAADCSGYIGDDMNDPRTVNILPFQENHSNLICYSNNVTIYDSPDVFYRIIPAELGINHFNISLCGSSFDTYLQVLNADGDVLASNDDYSFCSPQSELSILSDDNDTIYVIVQGWNTEKGDYSIEINNADLVSAEENEVEFFLYPNPTNGIVYINSHSIIEELNVYDMKGVLVHTRNSLSSKMLDLSHLENGVYIVEIQSEQNKSIHKLKITHGL